MIDTRMLTHRRFNLGTLEQIPLGEGRVFTVDGREIAVFRPREGGLYAVQARCPHRGGPLADGIVGAEQVVCPLHSYRFCLATGQPIGSPCDALETYAVQVSTDGEVLVDAS